MKCRICGNEAGNKTVIAREMMFGLRDTFEYLECGRCGCLQIATIPEDMGKYYPGNYYSFSSASSGGVIFKTVKSYLKGVRDFHLYNYSVHNEGILGRLLYTMYPYERIEAFRPLSHLKPLGKSLKILDVGCGKGELLLGLRVLGFDNLLGIDPFLEKNTFLDGKLFLQKEYLENMQGTYDIIILSHSFEHMSDPHGVMQNINSLLSANGVCIIRIPLADSYVREQYGTDWVEFDAPRHFFLHTAASMAHLTATHGLTIRRTLYDSTDFQFWGSEQYRKGIPLFGPGSYVYNKGAFPKQIIREYRRRAAALNAEGRGGRASFFIEKNRQN